MSSRQCENKFPTFSVFCWAKMFSKRYRSNKDSVKNTFLWFLHVLFCVFSCFLVCLVTMCWFSKRWANLQTREKLSLPQNTPNTVPKRLSKLIICVISDNFYRFNQTFWYSIVGVFLIEIHKNFKISDLFSKGFCIARRFYFSKNHHFRDELYSVIWNILYFCFWKYTLRNKNRCENSFHFFVFSVHAFEKPTFDDEKTVKIWVFTFFINFPSLKNRFPDISF